MPLGGVNMKDLKILPYFDFVAARGIRVLSVSMIKVTVDIVATADISFSQILLVLSTTAKQLTNEPRHM